MAALPLPPRYGTNHHIYTCVLKTFTVSKILEQFNSFAFYSMYVAFFYFRLNSILPEYITFFRYFWTKTKVVSTLYFFSKNYKSHHFEKFKMQFFASSYRHPSRFLAIIQFLLILSQFLNKILGSILTFI